MKRAAEGLLTVLVLIVASPFWFVVGLFLIICAAAGVDLDEASVD